VQQASFCCKTKPVNWIVLKNFSEVLQQNRRSGFGSLQRKSWEPRPFEVENHDRSMLTIKRSDGSTHPHCRSPTPTLNGRELTLPTRTQTSELEYSDLVASNRRPSTPYSRNTPRVFHKEHGRMLSRGPQSMWRRLCWKVKCSLYCCGRKKNRTGYHSGLIQLFGGVFLQGTWQRNCWLLENSQIASRAAQNALSGRVFETLVYTLFEIFLINHCGSFIKL